MINGLLLSKENLPMSWPLSSLDSPKSPLHTLPFLKLRISINHLLSLWMASSHTSQRKKKTPRYKQSFKALAWAAFFLPSCVNDGGGCALEVEPMIPSLPSSRSLLSCLICAWSVSTNIILSSKTSELSKANGKNSKLQRWCFRSIPSYDVYLLLFAELISQSP